MESRANEILKVHQPGFKADLIIETLNVYSEHSSLISLLDILRPPASENNPLLKPVHQVEFQAKPGNCSWTINGIIYDSLFTISIRSGYLQKPINTGHLSVYSTHISSPYKFCTPQFMPSTLSLLT